MTVLAESFRIWLAGGKNLQAVLANVQTAMDELSEKTVKHTLGGVLTGAQNEGILAAAEQSDAVGLVIASEVNDKNTCAPCAKIHGKILGKTTEMDKVRQYYPGGGFGGYVKCDGRERCRGTVRFKWQAQAVEPGAPKDPPPAVEIAPPPPPPAPDPEPGIWEPSQAEKDEFAAELAAFQEAAKAQDKHVAESEAAKAEAAKPRTPSARPGREPVEMPRHQFGQGDLRQWELTRQDLKKKLPRAFEEMQVHTETEGPLRAWEAALTTEEATAVHAYTTSAYLPMNIALERAGGARNRDAILAALQAGDPDDYRFHGRSSDEMADTIMSLWDALDKHPPRAEPVRVYRGVHPDPDRGYDPRAFYEQLNPGDVFEVNAFTSTSLQEAVSEGFTGRSWKANQGKSVMMEIDTKVGANVIGLHDMGDAEAEVVLPPNTRFRVVEPFDPETQKIRLEAIDDE